MPKIIHTCAIYALLRDKDLYLKLISFSDLPFSPLSPGGPGFPFTVAKKENEDCLIRGIILHLCICIGLHVTSYGLYRLLFQLAQEYHPCLDLHGVLEVQDSHTDQEHLEKQITHTLTCIQGHSTKILILRLDLKVVKLKRIKSYLVHQKALDIQVHLENHLNHYHQEDLEVLIM